MLKDGPPAVFLDCSDSLQLGYFQSLTGLYEVRIRTNRCLVRLIDYAPLSSIAILLRGDLSKEVIMLNDIDHVGIDNDFRPRRDHELRMG